MQALRGRLQSRRDWITQPRVARRALPWVTGRRNLNPERVASARQKAHPSRREALCHCIRRALHVELKAPRAWAIQPFQGCAAPCAIPRVARRALPWVTGRRNLNPETWIRRIPDAKTCRTGLKAIVSQESYAAVGPIRESVLLR
jgi:hypothetical protein